MLQNTGHIRECLHKYKYEGGLDIDLLHITIQK